MLDQDKFRKAWIFASEVHKEQKMPKSDISYLQHLGFVMMEVMAAHQIEPFKDISLAVQCAILHDTVEDQFVSLQTLEQLFGKDVSNGVSALTKNESLEKFEAMKDSLSRIKKESFEIWAVKLCDRISNLQNIPDSWSKEKLEKYIVEAELIYNELKDGHHYLAQRLYSIILSKKQ